MTPEEALAWGALALRVAQEAGALAARGFRRPMRVTHKGSIDLVTEFDHASERLIRERLAAEAPETAVVAEEGGGTIGSELTWFADPIDGTTNYVHGHPFWCVSIGLMAHGVCVAGAVVAPALDTWWMGALGATSLRNGEECRVSEVAVLDDALLATGFPYDRKTSPDNNFNAFIELKKQAQGVRRCGSAALDLCFVADGTYDGYWERKLRPWDLVAGSCVVNGAGGNITDLRGGPPDVSQGNLVVTNGHLHGALLAALAPVV
jgi:myo-inositol-1(or 4)-monophosphatase